MPYLPSGGGLTTMASSINMLLDVNVPVSIQLGSTRMTVRELIGLGKGTLVKLHRMAGEPVDVYVRNKLVAKGEITVVDDKLSLRVAQLYGEKEKFKHL
jgi:flagellar motor switch protein FliN/FliY